MGVDHRDQVLKMTYCRSCEAALNALRADDRPASEEDCRRGERFRRSFFESCERLLQLGQPFLEAEAGHDVIVAKRLQKSANSRDVGLEIVSLELSNCAHGVDPAS